MAHIFSWYLDFVIFNKQCVEMKTAHQIILQNTGKGTLYVHIKALLQVMYGIYSIRVGLSNTRQSRMLYLTRDPTLSTVFFCTSQVNGALLFCVGRISSNSSEGLGRDVGMIVILYITPITQGGMHLKLHNGESMLPTYNDKPTIKALVTVVIHHT